MAQGIEEWDEQPKEKKCSGVRCEGRVMGSRRIFAPQFKLQVLDSYRQDADCKGNQRATARKYGIHRRQIQKWLQMENHLRSITGAVVGAAAVGSVAETKAAMPPSPPPALPRTAPAPATTPTPPQPALNLSYEPAAARLRGADSADAGAMDDADPDARSDSRPGSISPAVDKDLPIKKRVYLSDEEAEDDGVALADDEEEDVDVDGTESEVSSTATGEGALDYTTATLSKRRSFSLQFKLEVLDAFHSDPLCQGNQRATARSFSINRRQVQKWLGQEAELREEAVSRGGLNRQRLGRWLEQDADVEVDEGLCLDLSRKRKDADDLIPESKKMRLGEWSDGDASDARSTGRDSVGRDSVGRDSVGFEVKQEMASPRSTPTMDAAGAEDWFRHQFQLAASNPFSFHPPLVFGHQVSALSYVPRLPRLPLMDKGRPTYSLDLKLGALDLYAAHSDFQQKWLKHEIAHNKSAFLLNSFR